MVIKMYTFLLDIYANKQAIIYVPGYFEKIFMN